VIKKWQNIFEYLLKALSIKTCKRMNRYSTFWFRFIRVGKYIMVKITAANAHKDFFDIVRKATENHQIYRIHAPKGDVVLMSQDEYESFTETLELLSTPGFKEKFEVAQKEVESGETVTF
jgi:antitoxin YefM